MRFIFLLCPLLLMACASDDESDADLSFAPSSATAPLEGNGRECGVLIWRGSVHQDYIDGSNARFCD